ncbi:MAG: holo-ACP synthase [Clostridia bacterium]|nr:holo-ACP synthase [Clostridia bacterium]MBR2159871.1 holo-ACP synthase [Clostridia bacterium]MBR2324305.1 holo-ACP synthase [Clostridia bacterium]MBR2874560.1 holo-ACP synthase [Clostridia bacterium]MBR6692762.1 holo-ACP synthase [Clostridia bacterium]
MKIGCDIEKVNRIALSSDGFFEKYFTQKERQYANSKARPMETYTGMFCAKEAFVKALGIGFDGSVILSEIEILHDNNGAPYYNLHGKAKASVENFAKLRLTISHTETDAIAFCLIED